MRARRSSPRLDWNWKAAAGGRKSETGGAGEVEEDEEENWLSRSSSRK